MYLRSVNLWYLLLWMFLSTGNASTYPRWRRLFAGMIISPTDLQYGNMIGEGMLIL